MQPEPTEILMRATLLRFALLVKSAVCVSCLLLGTLVAPSAFAVAAILAVAGWTAVLPTLMRRAVRPWLIGADVGLLGIAALAQHWLVPDRASADSTGWILAVLTVTSVTLQWFTSPAIGGAYVAALAAAYLGGAFWAVNSAELNRLTMLLWLIPQAVLSRIAASMLLAAARDADAMAAVKEHERRTAAVAAAVRADERRQEALLHDTVAATLLMVGAGAVQEIDERLAEQAARDLQVVRGLAPAAPTDLAQVLRYEIERSPLRIEHGELPSVRVPAPVAEAFAGAVHEVLTNVQRHAGVATARLSVERQPVRVTVADDGRGFRSDGPMSTHRRGVIYSIVGRMRDVGGRATITSVPGTGTVVTLLWPS